MKIEQRHSNVLRVYLDLDSGLVDTHLGIRTLHEAELLARLGRSGAFGLCSLGRLAVVFDSDVYPNTQTTYCVPLFQKCAPLDSSYQENGYVWGMSGAFLTLLADGFPSTRQALDDYLVSAVNDPIPCNRGPCVGSLQRTVRDLSRQNN